MPQQQRALETKMDAQALDILGLPPERSDLDHRW
jgi:hypothetical protein